MIPLAHREAVAMQMGDAVMTYGACRHRIGQLLATLHPLAKALNRPLVVVPFLPEGFDLVCTWVSGLFCPMVYVALNSRYSAREHRDIMQTVRPDVVITCHALWDDCQRACRGLDPHVVGMDTLEDCPVDDAFWQQPQHESEVILFSSGSTDVQKGVRHRFADFFWVAERLITRWQIRPHDRLLMGMPIVSAATLGCGVAVALRSEACLIIPNNRTPPTMAATIRYARPTVVVATPTTFTHLLTEPDMGHESVHFRGSVAGAPFNPRVLQAYQDRHIEIWPHYGMTECLALTAATQVGAASGPPLDGVSITIVDANHQPVAPGTMGDIWVKSPACCHGFLHRPSVPLVDGYFQTGDVGWCDESGALTVTGRRQETIYKGGNLILPSEIEWAVDGSGSSVVAMGVKNEWSYDDEIVLFMASQPHTTADTVMARLKDTLPSFKWPDHIVFLDTLPKGPQDKVSKPHLRAYWESKGRSNR